MNGFDDLLERLDATDCAWTPNCKWRSRTSCERTWKMPWRSAGPRG